jgi:hypothetical protein
MQAAGRMELDTLFIGGGGYSFPRYVEAVYLHATADSIEIDPAVTRAAYEHIGLSRETRIRPVPIKRGIQAVVSLKARSDHSSPSFLLTPTLVRRILP